MNTTMNYLKRSIKVALFLIIGFLPKLVYGQYMTVSCPKHTVNATCTFKIPSTYYFGGNYGTQQYTTYIQNGERILNITWLNAGTYTIKLLEGGQEVTPYTNTIQVYGQVGAVSISGVQNSMCQSETTSSYTASASNAVYFLWSISPATAGNAYSAGGNGSAVQINWNTSFAGDATVTVTAQGGGGDTSTKSSVITRNPTATFTATTYNPTRVCQGQPMTVGVTASHSQATYCWYESDNNTSCLGTSPYLPTTAQIGSFYRVVVTPSPSIPCLTNGGPRELRILASEIDVIPQVNSLTITSPISDIVPAATRCNISTDPTSFTANASSADSYYWELKDNDPLRNKTPGTITSSGNKGQYAVVTWDTSFDGEAKVIATAYGCGGSQETKSYIVKVNKLPVQFTVSALDRLCANTSAIINLNGSEPGVTYSLIQGSGTPTGITSWSVIGPGTYKVGASIPSCPIVETAPKTIDVLAPGEIQVAGKMRLCVGETLSLNASNGSNFRWIIQGQHITPDGPTVTVPNMDSEATSSSLSGNENVCGTYKTIPLAISVTGALNSLQWIDTPGDEFRCDGAGQTVLSVDKDGEGPVTWTLTAGAGNINHGTITWVPSFIGYATVKAKVIGCNQTIEITKTIEVASKELRNHKALTADASILCPAAKATLSLSNTYYNEVHSLYLGTVGAGSRLNGPGAIKQWMVSASDESYYTASEVPNSNCPVFYSNAVSVKTNEDARPKFKTNTGFFSGGEDLTLTACKGTQIDLSVTNVNAATLQWFKYDKNCNRNPYPWLSDDKKFGLCYTRLGAYGLPSDGKSQISFLMGWYDAVYVKGKESICNTDFEQLIYTHPKPDLIVSYIDDYKPLAFMVGTKTQSDLRTNFIFEGPIYEETWTISPPEAGTVTNEGLVTWNLNWHSFLKPDHSMTKAIVQIHVTSCSATQTYDQEVTVYPPYDVNENRVRKMMALQPMSTTNELKDAVENPFVSSVADDFLDGLGRNIQNVQYFGSSSLSDIGSFNPSLTKDLVAFKRYDEYDREVFSYLPYASRHTLDFRSDVLAKQNTYFRFNTNNKVTTDLNAYSETKFEPSPLNRVLKQGAPGEAWQPNTDINSMADNSVKRRYEFNTSDDQVILFSYKMDTKKITIANPISYYDVNKLYANKTYDENNNLVVEFTDMQGRTVLKRVMKGSERADTYYVYDDFGRLAAVVPPEGVKKLTGN